MRSLNESVLVFDLDDTLYAEVDYQRSGIRYLAKLTSELSGKPVREDIWQYYVENPQADHLAFVCTLVNWPASFKESLLWAYRLHEPIISLDVTTERFLSTMHERCHALAILTDGRIVSQSAKIRALGLDWIPSYISEVWDSPKPEPARFEAIANNWPDKQYVYVGDNPEKDFIAPNRLGWATIGLLGSTENIHAQRLEARIDETDHMPQYWVSRLSEIPAIFD